MKELALSVLASSLLACSAAPPRQDAVMTGGEDAGLGTGASTGSVTGGTSGATTDGDPTGRSGCEKMDILFVVDNSGSMTQEQQNLAQNFPKFIDVLNTARNGALDYRVGVTTTAFPTEFLGIQVMTGEQGTLLKTPTMSRPWLERSDPDLATTFTTIATVGVQGSGQEQPLRAARSAVIDRVSDGTNAGFVRSDALLAIVILTDEDDGSTAPGMQVGGFPLPIPGNEIPVSEFVSSFDQLKGARTNWASAVIAGAVAPMCNSAFGDATYAARLEQFVTETGENATFSSICEGDLSKSLADALNTFTAACSNFVLL